MARILIVLAVVLAVLVLAKAVAQAVDTARQSTEGANLPDTVKTMSYILLIVLMFGVVTGWLGGL